MGRDTLLGELSRIQSLLTRIIRNGIAAGEFRETDPKMAAECLLGMMHRLVLPGHSLQTKLQTVGGSKLSL